MFSLYWQVISRADCHWNQHRSSSSVDSLFYSEYKGPEAKNVQESNIQENVSSTRRRSQIHLQCITALKCTVIHGTIIDHLPCDCLTLLSSISPVQATSVGPDKAEGVLGNVSPLNSLVTQTAFYFHPNTAHGLFGLNQIGHSLPCSNQPQSLCIPFHSSLQHLQPTYCITDSFSKADVSHVCPSMPWDSYSWLCWLWIVSILFIHFFTLFSITFI